MNPTQKTIALAISGAFALSIAATSVQAASVNPFTAKSLSSGYQVADAEMPADAKPAAKAKDGKCGTGKCGANKKVMEKTAMAHDEKAKEGSCSADKAKEGSCSSDKATMSHDKMPAEKTAMEKTK